MNNSSKILTHLIIYGTSNFRVFPSESLEATTSEFSLKRGFHDWFSPTIKTNILRCLMQYSIKNVTPIDSPWTISDKTDEVDGKQIPIFSSAMDTAQIFFDVILSHRNQSSCYFNR